MDRLQEGYSYYRRLQIKVRELRDAGLVPATTKLNVKSWKLRLAIQKAGGVEGDLIKVGDKVIYKRVKDTQGVFSSGIVYRIMGDTAFVTWTENGKWFNSSRVELRLLTFYSKARLAQMQSKLYNEKRILAWINDNFQVFYDVVDYQNSWDWNVAIANDVVKYDSKHRTVSLTNKGVRLFDAF